MKQSYNIEVGSWPDKFLLLLMIIRKSLPSFKEFPSHFIEGKRSASPTVLSVVFKMEQIKIFIEQIEPLNFY